MSTPPALGWVVEIMKNDDHWLAGQGTYIAVWPTEADANAWIVAQASDPDVAQRLEMVASALYPADSFTRLEAQ